MVAIGAALFLVARPARADDGVAIGAVDAQTVLSTVTAAQSAVVDQAAAAAQAVGADAAQPEQTPSAPPTAALQTGSASDVPASISPAAPEIQPTSATPAPPQAVPSQPAAGAAVVAPADPVVSHVADAAGPPTSAPQGQAAPAAALHALAAQYQKNPGRYQPLNSLPISPRTASVSALESLRKRARRIRPESTPKPRPIPLPKCLQDLAQSVLPNGCDDALAQVSGSDLNAIASAAAHPGSSGGATHATSRPHPAPRPVQPPSTPRSVTTAPGAALDPRPAPSRVAVDPLAARRALPARQESVFAAAPAAQHLTRPVQTRSATPSRPSERESARAEQSRTPLWSELALVLLLVGIASIALAATSIRFDGTAAAGAITARVRSTGLGLTAVGTRIRSKGLTAGEQPVGRGRARPGIRYRD